MHRKAGVIAIFGNAQVCGRGWELDQPERMQTVVKKESNT